MPRSCPSEFRRRVLDLVASGARSPRWRNSSAQPTDHLRLAPPAPHRHRADARCPHPRAGRSPHRSRNGSFCFWKTLAEVFPETRHPTWTSCWPSDFPAEYWIHLYTANPIESAFAAVRLRTKVTRGAGSAAAALPMVFKLVESAQQRWRAVNAPHLVALVRAGARFERGHFIERFESHAA